MKQIHHKTGIKFYKGNPNYEKEYTHLRKLKCVKYKGGKCERCGYDKFPEILEFAHELKFKRNGIKNHIGRIKRLKWERVIEELDKCYMLCPTCHKIFDYILKMIPDWI